MEAVGFVDYTFAYPHENHPALRNISLTVERGEYILLCGGTGSGKTTLLRSVKKEIAPVGQATGEIRVLSFSRDSRENKDIAPRVGFVAQSPENQIAMDTVWHEMAFGLENLGLPPHVIRRRMAETANFFGIGNWMDKKTHTLSGGQKQTLNLASVMAMQPDILILDEPTALLDPIAAKEFLQVVSRINRELGTTVLLSEHRLEDILPDTHRVLFLSEGRIVIESAPRDFAKEIFAGREDFAVALPAAARIAHRLEEGERYPLSVREGRDFISKTGKAIRCTSVNAFGQPQREPAMEAKNLWFRYQKDDDFVIQDTSFSLSKGSIHAIVGGNGCGKTTLLHLLCGAYKPNRGRIRRDAGLRVGLLSQDPRAMFTGDTVWEELSEWQMKYGYSAQMMEDMLQNLGLTHLRKRHPYDLSGGEMQKTALGKLLLVSPDVLLLDEPTKGIDAATKAELAGIFRRLTGEGSRAVVLVTHDLDFAASVADRCSMLFHKGIACTDDGRSFFMKNMFYTTPTNRITRGFAEGCVLPKEVEYA